VTTALVLGGATGIGGAIARALAARGDRVVVADRNAEAGRELVQSIGSSQALFVHCDLENDSASEDAVVAATEFSTGELDDLVYTAGLLEAMPLAAWSRSAWERSLAVNLTAPFFAVQAARSALARSPRGRVILTSSTGALRGPAGMPAYHASKAGMLGLMRSLADELATDGTTVNSILPGWIDTPFNDAYWSHQADPDAARVALESSIPLKRQGVPDDVTGAVLFLASSQSSYITGQSIVIDGGFTAV